LKIIVTILGTIGDMTLATPMFSLIKEKYPASVTDIVCSPKNAEIIKDNPHINKRFIYKKKPFNILKLIFSLRAKNYDYLIDPKPHYSTEGATFARIIKAENKIGFVNDKHSPFNIAGITDSSGKHFVDIYLESLTSLGIESVGKQKIPQLFVNPDSRKYIGEIMNGEKKKALINISAGKEKRMFDLDVWTGFLSEVKNYNNSDNNTWDFYISYAPRDWDFAQKLMIKNPKLIDIRSRSLSDVIAAVELCDLVVTPDTALVHIASAFNRPIIAAYSGWEDNFKKFAPLSEVQQIIRTSSPQSENSLKDVSSLDLLTAWDEINVKL
jgi:ADP-heptose:LPS heptosyltransferase